MWVKVMRMRHVITASVSLFFITCLYIKFRDDVQPSRSCVNEFELMGRELFTYMSHYLRDKPYPGIQNYTNYIIARHNAKPLLNVEPIIPGMIPVYNNVRAFNCSIQRPECQPLSKTSLFMAVISAPANFEKRKAVRETWFTDLTPCLKLRGIELSGFAFVMGHSEEPAIEHEILKENETYDDILQVDIIDTYYNLTLKLTGLLNWLDNYCRSVNFVFKVDDDVYVNVRNLAWFVRQIKGNDPSIYCSNNDGIIQRESSKWKISYEDFPWQSYPYYCEGAAILIDGGAIRRLLAGAQTIPYLKFDDIYYTGLVAAKTGISLMMSDSIIPTLNNDGPDPCLIRSSVSLLLAKNISQMSSSHYAVDKFYKNDTQCVLYGQTSPVNPNEPVGMPLTRINASEQNLLFQMAEIARLSQ